MVGYPNTKGDVEMTLYVDYLFCGISPTPCSRFESAPRVKGKPLFSKRPEWKETGFNGTGFEAYLLDLYRKSIFYCLKLPLNLFLAPKLNVENPETEEYDELLWEVLAENGKMFPMLCEYNPKYSLKAMRSAWRAYVTKVIGGSDCLIKGYMLTTSFAALQTGLPEKLPLWKTLEDPKKCILPNWRQNLVP